eukprot:959583-Amorphochlora_amoeboformis.AAC.1
MTSEGSGSLCLSTFFSLRAAMKRPKTTPSIIYRDITQCVCYITDKYTVSRATVALLSRMGRAGHPRDTGTNTVIPNTNPPCAQLPTMPASKTVAIDEESKSIIEAMYYKCPPNQRAPWKWIKDNFFKNNTRMTNKVIRDYGNKWLKTQKESKDKQPNPSAASEAVPSSSPVVQEDDIDLDDYISEDEQEIVSPPRQPNRHGRRCCSIHRSWTTQNSQSGWQGPKPIKVVCDKNGKCPGLCLFIAKSPSTMLTYFFYPAISCIHIVAITASPDEDDLRMLGQDGFEGEAIAVYSAMMRNALYDSKFEYAIRIPDKYKMTDVRQWKARNNYPALFFKPDNYGCPANSCGIAKRSKKLFIPKSGVKNPGFSLK